MANYDRSKQFRPPTDEELKDPKLMKSYLHQFAADLSQELAAIQASMNNFQSKTAFTGTVTKLQQIITTVQETVTDASVTILDNLLSVIGVRSKLQFKNSAPITWTLADDNANSLVSLTPTLSNTGVAPTTYGDGTHVGQFTVDAQGRLTFAQNVLITSGAAGVEKESHIILAMSETEVTF